MDNKTVVQEHKGNFETLQRAFASGNVCMMDCTLKASGEHVAVICAFYENKDGEFDMIPFAAFFNGCPFELLVPPKV